MAQANPFGKLLAQANAQAGTEDTGEKVTCSECGEQATMLPPVNLQVMGDAEGMKIYEIKGVAGVGGDGNHFVCWKHLEFVNLDPPGGTGLGRYVLAGKEHGTQVHGVSPEAMESWRAAEAERKQALHGVQEL